MIVILIALLVVSRQQLANDCTFRQELAFTFVLEDDSGSNNFQSTGSDRFTWTATAGSRIKLKVSDTNAGTTIRHYVVNSGLKANAYIVKPATQHREPGILNYYVSTTPSTIEFILVASVDITSEEVIIELSQIELALSGGSCSSTCAPFIIKLVGFQNLVC